MGGQAGTTPLMRQYWNIKKQFSDSILLFRLGDFYEMFFEDAKVAAKILDIALTSRDKNADDPVPLCGVPHHSADSYIAKLLENGHKVAVCEQVEDPRKAKGIVRREVVRVITPGLRTDHEGLHPYETNALVSLYFKEKGMALAWLDVSSGDFKVIKFSTFLEAEDELSRLAPKEILFPEGDLPNAAQAWIKAHNLMGSRARIERLPSWVYSSAEQKLCERYSVQNLDGFGLFEADLLAPAAFALLHYVEINNRTQLPHLHPPKPYAVDQFVQLDPSTRDHLELFTSKGQPGSQHSLFGVLNETQTSMGAREFREWIYFPLRSVEKIECRLDAVEELMNQGSEREEIRAELSHVYDLERLISRVATRRCVPRDLVALRSTLFRTHAIKLLVQKATSLELQELGKRIDPHVDLYEILNKALVEDPPQNLNQGGTIRKGFHQELDELRKLGGDSREWIAELEIQERKQTGISSLKIKYNRVFGYYIEVTKSNLGKVPENYQRKQTLANAERFVTPELKEKENQILSAEEKMLAIEQELFENLCEQVQKATRSLQKLAKALATVDMFCCLARVSSRYRYTRPKVDDSSCIWIQAGRHPVVERVLSKDPFVPNDIQLDVSERQIIVLTGPNMAGKSTIMRQVALIVLLAQMGCFVPAEEAHIGVVDRVFTRVGASDDLTRGRSTFMVEMSETANILRNATESSLILLDEIGRGTSTFDGLSLAWAVAEDLHDRVGAKTIFATHYHELTDLARTKPRVKNMNVQVKEWGEQIIFLRTLAQGAVNRSYGIEVARLAGVLPTVLDRAKEILSNLEKGELDATGRPIFASSAAGNEGKNEQFELFRRMADDLWKDFQTVDLDELSSKQALDLLYTWQKRYRAS